MSLTLDAPGASEKAPRPVDARVDYEVIRELIAYGSRILDIGCGDGSLMHLLQRTHGARVSGIELGQQGVADAVARGLSVIQGDADTDLSDYPDRAFDYVVLSQTLQATRDPRLVLDNMLRIGKCCVVSFPNFGFWRVRMQLLTKGRMPQTGRLPDPWWSTPNIHLCTIRDFVALCDAMDVTLMKAIALDHNGKRIPLNAPWWFWNLFGEQAVFLIRR